MPGGWRSVALAAVSIPLGGLVAACAPVDLTIRPDPPTFAAPAIDPVPLQVGYTLSEGLDRPLVHRVGPTDDPNATYTFELGPSSRAMFERLLPALFDYASAEVRRGASGTIEVQRMIVAKALLAGKAL